MREENSLSFDDIKSKLKIGAIVLAVLVGLAFLWNSYTVIDSREYAVVQTPTGKLFTIDQGPHLTYWGSVTKYKKSFQYEFSNPAYVKGADKSDPDNSIRVRFNDGGHAHLSGSVRIDEPSDEPSRLKLHTKYGSQKAIENQLVHNTIINAVYLSAPLLSSKESAGGKRNELINWISDQAEAGVYKTTQVEAKQKNSSTGETETVTEVQYFKDSTGAFIRQEASPLKAYNLGFSALSLLGLDYEKDVEDQIQAQQKLTMQVQTAQAQAKQAEQQTITTQEQGKATAAKAKWDQEALKATAVTAAEQERDVAKLNTEKEAFNKQAMILKGQGEAAYKAAVTQANNNLELKLNAAIEINKNYAAAMANSNWVPTYVSGSGGYASGGAAELIQLMTANVAKQVGLTDPNPAVQKNK